MAAPRPLDFSPEMIRAQRKPYAIPEHKKNIRGQRLYVIVEDYEVGGIAGRPVTYAVGRRLDDQGKRVKVRSNTTKERDEDLLGEMTLEERNAKSREVYDKVLNQYSKGYHRRPSIPELKSKNPRLLKFDQAIFLDGGNGVEEYRANWAESVAHGDRDYQLALASVVITPGNENVRPQAYIETINRQVELTEDNSAYALTEEMDIDSGSSLRRPSLHLRLFYGDEMIHSERVYPGKRREVIRDRKTGENREVFRWMSASDSFVSIMTAEKAVNRDDRSEQVDRSNDYVRTVIMALLQQSKFKSGQKIRVPELSTKNDVAFSQGMRNIFNGIISGKLRVDIISGERINFGPGTARTLFKQLERAEQAEKNAKKFYNARQLYWRKQKLPPLVSYVAAGAHGKEVSKRSAEELYAMGFKPAQVKKLEIPREPKNVRGFLPTVIGYAVHDSGVKYATFAEPLRDGDRVILGKELTLKEGLSEARKQFGMPERQSSEKGVEASQPARVSNMSEGQEPRKVTERGQRSINREEQQMQYRNERPQKRTLEEQEGLGFGM